jgi:hypothetical protein
MRLSNVLPYVLFAIQARTLCKRYTVSAEYMEIVLRIEWHRKRDPWTDTRYQQELQALAGRYPDDVLKHMKGTGPDDGKTTTT